jgi:carbon monoxide dehydrogenase subunit G
MEIRDEKNSGEVERRNFAYSGNGGGEDVAGGTERPKHAVYEGNGDVPGGSATLRAGFELEPAPGGATKVIWSGQSNVMGRIASLAGGLLQPLAKKNVQKLIDGLQKALT